LQYFSLQKRDYCVNKQKLRISNEYLVMIGKNHQVINKSNKEQMRIYELTDIINCNYFKIILPRNQFISSKKMNKTKQVKSSSFSVVSRLQSQVGHGA